MICSYPTTIYDRAYPHCIHNIFTNRRINEKCKFVRTKKDEIPTAIKVSNNGFLLSNVQGQATVKCNKQLHQPLTLSSHTLVTLQCNCEIHTTFFTITNYVPDCTRFPKETTIKYPINLPQLIQLGALPDIHITSKKVSS